MSTISARTNTNTAGDTRTDGGKITRIRRPPPSSRIPYARPSPSLVVKEDETENPNWLSNLIYPAKVIVSGAGKILNFFGNHYSSSSEEDSENDDDEVDEVDNDEPDKVFSPINKSANKRNLEQLVLEETFSREEGNQLIRLIKSRMVGNNGTPGEGTPPNRSTAIMEARKWLQEKRSGSKKTLEVELDSSSHFTRSEKGSPADMAKSYMQNRPAWASSSSKHIEFGSPSTLGMLHYKEETPTSTLRSSELKRSSFAAGSWNLLDEIRRVRSKATEEFLATAPSTKTTLSLLSPENEQDILGNNGNVEGAGPAESAHAKPDTGLHDAVATFILRDNQDGNAAQSAEHQDRLEAADVSVLQLNQDNEVNDSRITPTENGIAAPGVQGENGAQKHNPSQEENGNLIGSNQEGTNIHLDNPSTLTDPTESMINGSQTNSSLQEEELSQDLTQPTIGGPTTKSKELQNERKPRGSTRRGRGRGK